MLRAPSVVLIVAAFAAVSCGEVKSPTEPMRPPLATGHWGGQMCLNVSDATVSVVVGCSYGTFPRPELDASGSFVADGMFGGGPGPSPAPGALPPARFAGTVAGDTVRLTITNAAQTFGPFTATRGAATFCAPPCP